jgi:hypothetical protein
MCSLIIFGIYEIVYILLCFAAREAFVTPIFFIHVGVAPQVAEAKVDY